MCAPGRQRQLKHREGCGSGRGWRYCSGTGRRSPIGRGTAFRAPSVRVRVSPSAREARGHRAPVDAGRSRQSLRWTATWRSSADEWRRRRFRHRRAAAHRCRGSARRPNRSVGAGPAGTVTGTVVGAAATGRQHDLLRRRSRRRLRGFCAGESWPLRAARALDRDAVRRATEWEAACADTADPPMPMNATVASARMSFFMWSSSR